PVFPARGAMEWHADLKAYVDALRSRGDLPEHTNLDELQSVDDAGVWRLVTGNEYGGLPDGFSVTFATVFRVEHSGANNAVVQTIVQGRGSGPLDVWVREANTSSTWGVWHRLITDSDWVL